MSPVATSCDLSWFASLATVIGLLITVVGFAFFSWRYISQKQEELGQSRRTYADSLIARASGVEGLRLNPQTSKYETSEYIIVSAIVGLRDFPEYLPVMDMMLEHYSNGGRDLERYRKSMAESIALAEKKLSRAARAKRPVAA